MVGPGPNPIAQKVTSDHITQIIGSRVRETELEYADRKHSRGHSVVAFLVGATLLVILIIALALLNHSDLVDEILKLGAVLLGGFGGGYGYSEWRHSHD